MGKYGDGYARVDRDLYPTPEWAIEALAEHLDLGGQRIWECACGTGQMSEALVAIGAMYVFSTDIADYGYHKFDRLLDFVHEELPASQKLRRTCNQSTIRKAWQTCRKLHRSWTATAGSEAALIYGAAAEGRF
jgi:hypothetical protein